MEELQFKDFGTKDDPRTSKLGSEQGGIIGNVTPASDSETTSNKTNFFQINFYRQFFDIDQDQILTRIINSAYPRKNGNYIVDFIQPNPDLYGPFWISTTLVFAIAIFGSLANFVKTYGTEYGSSSITDFRWVTGATSLIFCYVVFMPALIYAFQWYRHCALQYRYLEILNAYGYSISFFVPISILWFLSPFEWFRWLLTIVSVSLTLSVLFLALWPIVKADPNRLVAFGFIASVIFAHIIFALCLKEYFFETVVITPTMEMEVPVVSVAPAPLNNSTHSM